jgi:four helix bundle protein
MKHEEFNEIMRQRTKTFAVAVVQYCNSMPQTPATKVISYQFIKAGTSVAANYRAFCRARSRNERYAKICIVVEEADESVFWTEVILESKIDNSEILCYLQQEGTEILKIMAKTKVGLEPP